MGGSFRLFDRCSAARAPAESGRWKERAGTRSRTRVDRAALAISSRPLLPPRVARREQPIRVGKQESSSPSSLPRLPPVRLFVTGEHRRECFTRTLPDVLWNIGRDDFAGHFNCLGT